MYNLHGVVFTPLSPLRNVCTFCTELVSLKPVSTYFTMWPCWTMFTPTVVYGFRMVFLQFVFENQLWVKSGDPLDLVAHCNENPTYIFLFWEERGLSPNFHIHVSVSDLYSPRMGLHISSSRIGRPIVGIYKSLTGAWCGNWDWDPDIPFLGIFVSKFRYIVFAVQSATMLDDVHS